MRSATGKPNRRDVLKTIGGALGGISLLGHGTARGQAIGSMPNGYKFYRVLTANEGGTFGMFENHLGNMTGSVMMASPGSGTGIGYVYVHGTRNPRYGKAWPGVFEVAIGFDSTPPVVGRVLPMAIEGLPIYPGGVAVTVGHIGTGASNSLGEYVTTISPAEPSETIAVANSPGVYLYRSGGVGTWSRIIGFGDPAPDDSFYGGDFGDVALDDDENLLLAAATTQSPGDALSGFAGSQALIATSLSASESARGRVVLRTGDMLPFVPAAIESVGLIDLAANHAFAAQLSAKRLDRTVTRSGTALMVGNTQGGQAEQRIVAASTELISPERASHLHITSGQTFFGPRVDPQQDVAFVTHDGTFEPSTGSNDVEMLGYYSRGVPHQLQRTRMGASSGAVITFGAPCINSTGLMYGTKLLGDGTTQLYISDGENSDVVVQSRDRLPGRAPEGDLMLTEILFGQHPTQVDSLGRLAFTAEFLLNPSRPEDPKNVITCLVIGIPE